MYDKDRGMEWKEREGREGADTVGVWSTAAER